MERRGGEGRRGDVMILYATEVWNLVSRSALVTDILSEMRDGFAGVGIALEADTRSVSRVFGNWINRCETAMFRDDAETRTLHPRRSVYGQ
jgi:hypothetical protein